MIIRMYNQLPQFSKGLTLCHQRQAKQSTAFTSLCSENRFSQFTPPVPLSLRLLNSSLTPPKLQSYLHLSFLISASFKQASFSTVEMEQPSIVYITKKRFMSLWCAT